ncbi:MAG: hypothetical protein HC837_14880 [Chloroflexaceae bacterium]|nr:hypothetical protein [Chloroflexaceae bacterium]
MMTLLERYQLFLEQLVATPDLPIDQLPHYQLSSAQPLAGAASRPPYVAPTSELEQTIARIWQRVLQIDQIGIHDNFFDLGGRSLAMMQVCSELAATIPGIHVVDLSRQFTISDMACYLNQSRQPESMDRQALDAITRRQKEAMKRRQERARQRSKG